LGDGAFEGVERFLGLAFDGTGAAELEAEVGAVGISLDASLVGLDGFVDLSLRKKEACPADPELDRLLPFLSLNLLVVRRRRRRFFLSLDLRKHEDKRRQKWVEPKHGELAP